VVLEKRRNFSLRALLSSSGATADTEMKGGRKMTEVRRLKGIN
jgi:hypothetical protein